jgi:hypothetical protein
VVVGNWSVDVALQFSPGSEMLASESETFQVSLSGTEASPIIQVKATSEIFAYQSRQISGKNGQAAVELKASPRWSAAELGETSIQGLSILRRNGVGYVSFADHGLKGRSESTIRVVVKELSTGSVIVDETVQSMMGTQLLPLGNRFVKGADYEIQLEVTRTGASIQGLEQNEMQFCFSKMTRTKLMSSLTIRSKS